MAILWRDYKCETIKAIEKEVASVGVQAAAKNTIPNNAHSLEEWTNFVKFVITPIEVARRAKFKDMRKAKTLTHHTSKKSFARVEQELKKNSDEPEKITRADVWLAGYESKIKDGDENVEDDEVVREVKEKMAQSDSSQWSINDDPVSQVLGPERRGQVRGYGFGAKPSLMIGKGHTDTQVANLEKELQELKMIVKDLVSRSEKGDNSSENSNISIPQKRKEVDNISTISKQARSAPQKQQLMLLSWYDLEEKIVATADLVSQDPADKVHFVPLDPGCWKVWVREVIEDIALFRPTSEFSTLSAAIGSTVA